VNCALLQRHWRGIRPAACWSIPVAAGTFPARSRRHPSASATPLASGCLEGVPGAADRLEALAPGPAGWTYPAQAIGQLRSLESPPPPNAAEPAHTRSPSSRSREGSKRSLIADLAERALGKQLLVAEQAELLERWCDAPRSERDPAGTIAGEDRCGCRALVGREDPTAAAWANPDWVGCGAAAPALSDLVHPKLEEAMNRAAGAPETLVWAATHPRLV